MSVCGFLLLRSMCIVHAYVCWPLRIVGSSQLVSPPVEWAQGSHKASQLVVRGDKLIYGWLAYLHESIWLSSRGFFIVTPAWVRESSRVPQARDRWSPTARSYRLIECPNNCFAECPYYLGLLNASGERPLPVTSLAEYPCAP